MLLKMSAALLVFVSLYSIANQTNLDKDFKNYKNTECVLEDLATAGLGDVKYSLLSEAQFQNVNGDEWVLLEGQTKTSLGISTEPSVFDYFTSGDNTSTSALPDARGVFFRMKDHGSNRNTDGATYKLGQYQADQYKSHNHTLPRSNTGWGGGGGANNVASHDVSGTVNSNYSGGVETRSKNITINAFVKIKQKCLDAVALAERRAAEDRIQALEDYIVRNTCETCLTLPEVDLADLQAKNVCFKAEIDDFEAGTNDWSVTCQARTVGEAKRVLMLIGAANRSTDEENFLSHLDNQYPYYNVIETN